MVSVRTLVRMKRGGSYHPPGSVFHDLSEAEIGRLAGHVERIEGEASPGSSETAADGDALHPPSAAIDDAHSEADEAGEAGRVADVLHALDLLEAADFDAEGAPAVKPLADVLGFEPSADEIAAALALKAELGH